MKFNFNDFLELDTNGLLAVNGGYYCNGSSPSTTSYPNTYYPTGGGGGGGTSSPSVVGGGCSGVVAAIKATNKANEVTIIERNSTLLKKLLLTGNGRCNFLNDDFSKEHFHSIKENDIFVKPVAIERHGDRP